MMSVRGKVLALVFALTSPLAGQSVGRIVGQVLDATGAALPRAQVTAKNEATGMVREGISDATGRYVLADLPIGSYSVTAAAAGFQAQVQEHVQVSVATFTTNDFTLQPSQVHEAVQVTGQAATVDPNGTLGFLMNTQQIADLPINGRDYGRFTLLTPGAVARSNLIGDLSFDGHFAGQNQYTIDGVDASRVDLGYISDGFERGARLLTGSIETIVEFRVQTSNYRAENGRAAGSFVSIATKSGGNQVHGTAYDYLRNSAFDARNFVNAEPSPQAPFRYNDFGANISGPIVKDKTFFFLNYEGSRQALGATGSGTVPSASMRAITLSASPVLAPIVQSFPLGTGHTSNPLIDSYTTSQVLNVREDTGSLRVDQNVTDKDLLYARVNVNDSHVAGPLFPLIATSLGTLDRQNVPSRISNVVINYEHLFSPDLVNEFNAGMQRFSSQTDQAGPYPVINITGIRVAPGSRNRVFSNSTIFQYTDATTWVRGSHTLKWGEGVWFPRANRRYLTTQTITYTSLTDFIYNSATSASQTAGDLGTGQRGPQFGLFVQDTWQAAPKLTIDYGLRYDYFYPTYDSNGIVRPFDTRSVTLAPEGAPYFGANTKNFGPRFAIAWQPSKRFVIRSGYGIFFAQFPVGWASASTVRLNTLPGNTSLLRTQIPDLGYPITPFIGQGAVALPTVWGYSWYKPDSYSQQWNFTVQTALGAGFALQTAYVGNRGLNLFRTVDINQLSPALARRPIGGFADINLIEDNGQSTYHALQVSLQRRLRAGLLMDFNYTFSKAIDNVQDSEAGVAFPQPQNPFDLRAERGLGSVDIRHNVSYNVIYDLPVGWAKGYLSQWHGFMGNLVSGWQLAPLAILRTGIPATVTIGQNTSGTGVVANQRPNAVVGPSPYASDQTPNHWLNPAAYSIPTQGTFGNLGRNTIIGPNFQQVDLSLIKMTKFSEKLSWQLRAEVFNLFNHPNFATPSLVFGTPSFGQIFSTLGNTIGLGTSRQIQLATKFIF